MSKKQLLTKYWLKYKLKKVFSVLLILIAIIDIGWMINEFVKPEIYNVEYKVTDVIYSLNIEAKFQDENFDRIHFLERTFDPDQVGTELIYQTSQTSFFTRVKTSWYTSLSAIITEFRMTLTNAKMNNIPNYTLENSTLSIDDNSFTIECYFVFS